MEKLRIYGEAVRTWTAWDERRGREVVTQREYTYREYYPDGTLAGTGTEDFSTARAAAQMLRGWVYTWDGEKRNRGGYRWWTNQGYVLIPRSQKKAAREYFRNKYHAALAEIRTY